MVNALDRAIAAVAPGWAARRVAARAQIEQASLAVERLRAFNAVSKGRRAGDGWVRVGAEGPTDSVGDIAELAKRARIANQNNPYWVSALNAVEGLVVGHGIRCSIGSTRERDRKALQDAWDTWADSAEADVAGQLTWYGIQGQSIRCVVDGGECLVVRRQLGAKLQLQVLSGDYLSVEKDGSNILGDGRIVGGVESDAYGRPVAYHLYDRHPSEGRAKTVRIDASEVAHVYRIDRPGQKRGVSWIAPVFTRLADWDSYEDADLMRQKVAACFAVIYSNSNVQVTGDWEPTERIEPGMVEHVPAGTNVQTVSPPASLGIRDMALITHRAIATGLGITYEALTGDYSQVNFASGRLAHLQQAVRVRKWQRDIMMTLLCARVFEWFRQAQMLKRGEDAVPPSSKVWATWNAQSVYMVDPAAETKANRERVRSGFASLSQVIREQGGDPEEVLTSMAADQKRCDQLGLVLDTDARKVSAQGQGSINQKDEGADSGKASEKAA